MPIATATNPFCVQSARDYPNLVAADLGLSGALNGTESVVTLGIGGNDHNLFASAIALCGASAPIAVFNIGAPCKQTYGNHFDQLITSDVPSIGHDVCQPAGVSWIEPPLSGQPIHPGPDGAAAQARIVAAAIS